MKKIRILILLLALLLLAGCAKDYTREDAEKKLEKAGIKAEFVLEKTDDKDTIWTYKDKNGTSFRVIEYWYVTGIDATKWDASKLLNEYPYLMTDTYIKDIPVTAKIDKTYNYKYTDFLTSYTLTYEFKTEDELKAQVKECNKVAKALRKKNKHCKFIVVFQNEDENFETSRTISRNNKKIKYKNVLKNYRERNNG